MPRSPLPVSVLLPVRDPDPDAIRRCLDALARLDPAPIEVLVVESNSRRPAGWEEVARHCARLGPRFRFLSLGAWPGGRAGALNLALREATAAASVVAVLDADTLAAPDWLARGLPALADGETVLVAAPSGAGVGALLPDGALLLARRAALQAVGGWQDLPAAEEELAPRLMRAGWRVAVLPDALGRPVAPPDAARRVDRAARQAAGVAASLRRHAGAMLSPRRHLTPAQRIALARGWAAVLADAAARCALLGAMALAAGVAIGALPPPSALPFLLAALLPWMSRGLPDGWRGAWDSLAEAGAAGRGALGAAGGDGLLGAAWLACVLALVAGWPSGMPGLGVWLAALVALGAPLLPPLVTRPAQKPANATNSQVVSRFLPG